jgi:hypothetical protein
MTVSSKLTEKNCHPSSLLACSALPNHQDGCDSMMPNSKTTAESTNDCYDRSFTSRRYALVGAVCSYIVSCCIIAGIIDFFRGSNEAVPTTLNNNLQKDSTMYGVHRLRFKTNLRLLVAARGWRNPNGALLNIHGYPPHYILQLGIARHITPRH